VPLLLTRREDVRAVDERLGAVGAAADAEHVLPIPTFFGEVQETVVGFRAAFEPGGCLVDADGEGGDPQAERAGDSVDLASRWKRLVVFFSRPFDRLLASLGEVGLSSIAPN
jgi:hypothetical protein